jgi:hypothetical protein
MAVVFGGGWLFFVAGSKTEPERKEGREKQESCRQRETIAVTKSMPTAAVGMFPRKTACFPTGITSGDTQV